MPPVLGPKPAASVEVSDLCFQLTLQLVSATCNFTFFANWCKVLIVRTLLIVLSANPCIFHLLKLAFVCFQGLLARNTLAHMSVKCRCPETIFLKNQPFLNTWNISPDFTANGKSTGLRLLYLKANNDGSLAGTLSGFVKDSRRKLYHLRFPCYTRPTCWNL